MQNVPIHKKFKLNGTSFLSASELVSYLYSNEIEGSDFLESWFDRNDYVIVQTSGSTGVPKEIKIKKEYMINSALATGLCFDLVEGTQALLCMSSKFIAGKMMWVRALSLGWELTVVPVSSKPLLNTSLDFDFAAMVPLQVANSLGQMKRIKTLIVGGGVVSKELSLKIQKIETVVYATYGMTETVTHIAIKKLNKVISEERNSYRALPNVEFSLDNRGCLVIDAPLIAEGNVVTNDLVNLLSNKSFEWLGRYDSIINSGGVKLIPEQLENKISKIVKTRFFIAGVYDALLGEKAVLFIEEENAKVIKKVDVKEFLSETGLERYEIPKEIYFVEKFLMTETGKIKRAATVEKYL